MKPPKDARMTRWCANLMLAWIAWQHSVFQSKGLDEWTPAGATETSEECKQTAVTASGNTVRKLRTQDKKGTIFTQSSWRGTVSRRYMGLESSSRLEA